MAAKKAKKTKKSTTKSGYDYLVAALRKDKKANYADIAAGAKKNGLSVYPIMFGRAQAALGLVKSKPRGKGKAPMASKAKRRPGRPRKTTARSGPDGLAAIIATVKRTERELNQLRTAMRRIQTLVDDALA